MEFYGKTIGKPMGIRVMGFVRTIFLRKNNMENHIWNSSNQNEDIEQTKVTVVGM